MTHAVSIVIPTYRRERVLVDTIESLLALAEPAREIVVVDQTLAHEPATETFLAEAARRGQIKHVRASEPSIPKAMNRGLLEASNDIVLFIDDDIRPEHALVASHARAHEAQPGLLIAGRVVQPWEEGADFTAEPGFRFAGVRPAWIEEFMGGNFSLRREDALSVGGFDENFIRVAYRFEAEFAHRWCASGRRIRFEPLACLHHLKAGDGGTRSFGEHLTTWRPDHAVGAYYYGLTTGHLREFLARPVRSIATRYHLRHPWRIPATLLAEFGGMAWAVALFLRGPGRIVKPGTELP